MEEAQRLRLRFCNADTLGTDSVHEPAAMVVGRVPLIHPSDCLIADVDGKVGPFGDEIQFAVCDQGGDFDDLVVHDVEPRHFEVDPHQSVPAHDIDCSVTRINRVLGASGFCSSMLW